MMKFIFLLSLGSLFLMNSNKHPDSIIELNQIDLIGAWEAEYADADGNAITMLAILDNGYISVSAYSVQLKKYVGTFGGSWNLTGKVFTQHFEYHTLEPSKLGQSESMEIATLEGKKLIFKDDPIVWTKIDDGTPGELNGAWLITGRKRNGEITKRTPGARKTMKILSGTKFQWIAYHTETGAFSGTGGGSYNTIDGKYTEHIDFFSRDSSRVGASLEFDYSIKDGEWHHSGLSSKGDPIYEIWTLRTKLDKD